MRIGYPCINLSLPCRSSRTFRLASWSERRFIDTVDSNLCCLSEILRYNVDHGLLLFRITSDLIPFASHPICTVPWQDLFETQFQHIGDFIRKTGVRVTMHPGQYTVINSPDEHVLSNAVAELVYHAEVLELLGLDRSHKIQIHAGGIYGDKSESMRRFIRRYRGLPFDVRERLVIENDERLYDLNDCLAIYGDVGTPVVLDVLHLSLKNRGESLAESFARFTATWSHDDGLPTVDYSSKDKWRKGKHSRSLNTDDFLAFLASTQQFDFDIMLEIKDKEKSALRALQLVIGGLR